MTESQKLAWRVAGWAGVALLVPLVSSRIVEGWNWGPGAFACTYLLFFSTGMAYTRIARHAAVWTYKAGVALALVAGFVLGWATMVHLSETERPIHLVNFGVLAVGAIGAVLARLRARGLSYALFAMAAALILAWTMTQVVFTDSIAGPVWNIGVVHGGFVLLFATSGLLFRHASRHELHQRGQGRPIC